MNLKKLKELLIDKLKEGVSKRGSLFLVIVPTFNEAENIRELIERLVNDVDAAIEICVVDDNSSDGTRDVVESLQAKVPNLHLYKRRRKMGLGSAYLAGFELAFASGFKYMITMDADLSHDPKIINNMEKEIENYDVIIGSRFVHGGGMVDIQLKRIALSKFGNFITDKLLGMPFHDCTSGYRCYRLSAISRFNLEKEIVARKYVFLVELLLLLFYSDFRIKEIPIIFINRLKGKTKVNMSEMFHAGTIIVFLIFKNIIRKFKR